MSPQRDDLNRTIGKRLRAARAARGLSQKDLALLMDGSLPKVNVSSFEKGIRRPSVEAACALAEALGNVSAAHLLCVDDVEAGFSADEKRLLSEFRAADDYGRRTILMVAEMQASYS